MLCEMIHDSDKVLYTGLNSVGTNQMKVYQSPSLDDKMILLNTIMTYLSEYCNLEEEKLHNIAENIIGIYNKINISYTMDTSYSGFLLLAKDTTLLKVKTMRKIAEKLTFLNQELINILINSGNTKPVQDLTEVDINLMKIQLFTFASVFIDMNDLTSKLINYLEQSTNE